MKEKLNIVNNKTERFKHKINILKGIIEMRISEAKNQMLNRLSEFNSHYSKRLKRTKEHIEEDYITNFKYSEENKRFYEEFFLMNLHLINEDIAKFEDSGELNSFLKNTKETLNREIRQYFTMGTTGIRQPALDEFIKCKVYIELLIPLLNELETIANKEESKNSNLSDLIVFSEIVDGEIKLYEDKLKEVFNFVGEGVDDINYDTRHNEVWVNFYPLSATRHIPHTDWNKVEKILTDYINEYKGISGLKRFTMSNYLKLVFDDSYEMGVY